jgi:putative flavoprotein involved in K+ transport
MTSPGGAQLDVLVVGGGQAGLAMGYHLARRGHRFEIVDAGAEIGQVWRSRWDSLRLFTSARYDNLPGLPFPAPRRPTPARTTSRTTCAPTPPGSSCRCGCTPR